MLLPLTKNHVSQTVFPLPQMTNQIDTHGNFLLYFENEFDNELEN